MFCTNCGVQLKETDAFCSNCGTPVVKNSTYTQAETKEEFTAPETEETVAEEQA